MGYTDWKIEALSLFPISVSVLDFHSHLIPDVDDGAADPDQARAALGRMRDQGISTVITTPHFDASLTLHPERFAERMQSLDRGWRVLREIAAAEFPALRLERGVELRLDNPSPDLADVRTRLAGTAFVLVEFAGFRMPPNAVEVLAKIASDGWIPILAHPERYTDASDDWVVWETIRSEGCWMQVNTGSPLGVYGPSARATAWGLLERGWVDYLASDYHARGLPTTSQCRETLLARGAAEQVELLMETNPHRILSGEHPVTVPPIRGKETFWQKIRRFTG